MSLTKMPSRSLYPLHVQDVSSVLCSHDTSTLWPCSTVLHVTNAVVVTMNAFNALHAEDVGFFVVDTAQQFRCSLCQIHFCDPKS